jgi:D-glycero-beta-D-manno-heptose-7-phosphate kinase
VNVKKLNGIIDGFRGKKVLVLGDIILDEYVFVKVSRISPEATVPVVEALSYEQLPGGAAYVASHIKNLGGEAYLAGVVGTDKYGGIVGERLKAAGISLEGVIEDAERPTSVKTRVIAQHQQIVRIDNEKKAGISHGIVKELLSYIERSMESMDAVIISDYGKGVVIPSVFKEAIRLARRRRLPVCVDPKPTHCLMYKGVTVITPNTKEAGEAINRQITDESSLLAAGKELLKKTGSEAVLITRGEHGMSLFRKGRPVLNIPTFAREVFDVTGAGDTVISVLALSLAAGADMAAAAHISNAAAGVVVGKIGTATLSTREIKGMLR